MKCKKVFDGRQLPRKAKEQLRVAAVKRVESGESPEFVAAGLGINRRTIYRWIEAFHYGGEEALKAKPIPGAPPKLDAKQMQKLARIAKATTQTKDELKAMVERVMRRLQKLPEIVAGFFHAPTCAYAKT